MFLIPEEYYNDESLESYLLRISHTNSFESYRLLSGALKDHLKKTDINASGAFPLELSQVNIFHAKQSSSFRIRAIHLLEKCIGLPEWQLYNLAVKHSLAHFARTYAVVIRHHVNIPRCFMRRNSIPVCPKCLEESAYIRHNWHLTPYAACHQHKCVLVERCPSCGSLLDYMKNESITECECGQDLRQIHPTPASNEILIISQLISGENILGDNPLFRADASLRNGSLLFYWLRHHSHPIETMTSSDFTEAIDYFEQWPNSFYAELNSDMAIALDTQTRNFNKTAFLDVFGPILQQVSIPSAKNTGSNFIRDALVNFLIVLVSNNPKSKTPNLGDLLLNISETASILACSHEQIYRFYEEGYLQLSFSPVLHQKLSIGMPAFYLRQVIELLLATQSCETDELAAW